DGKKPEWREIFEACAEAGLYAVEIDATDEMLGLARSCGLDVSASYVGLPLHEPYESLKVDQAVMPIAERLAAAGGTDLLLNADPANWKNPPAKTEEAFQRQGENLSRVAERVKPLGLKVCMHNHAADNHNASGDWRSVVEHADASVGLCVDIGWAHVAGCDPIGWIRKEPDRVFAFHFRNQYGKVPAEDLLEGELDIERIMTLPELADYEGWLSLELWHPESMEPARTMTKDARRSVDFLKSLS
ncbi:MAG TPA: sugar phosphate isomerase/epimerase, partial [Bacillales bacterium]|nr:sugar phosphate isomerase/epimerase [Bacillales bacterium]